jgi:hypothetical protein
VKIKFEPNIEVRGITHGGEYYVNEKDILLVIAEYISTLDLARQKDPHGPYVSQIGSSIAILNGLYRSIRKMEEIR